MSNILLVEVKSYSEKCERSLITSLAFPFLNYRTHPIQYSTALHGGGGVSGGDGTEKKSGAWPWPPVRGEMQDTPPHILGVLWDLNQCALIVMATRWSQLLLLPVNCKESLVVKRFLAGGWG